MIVLWFYLTMATGMYIPQQPSYGMTLQKPKEIFGPFKTQAHCNQHRGQAEEQDGLSKCVSIKVRWQGSDPPSWSWTPKAETP